MGLRASRRRLNLLLAASLLALAALAWLGRRDGEEHPPPLTTLDPVQVNQLRLERPAAEELHLEKMGQSWLLTAPDRLPASATQVRDLLALLTAVPRASYRADQVDPTVVGLDPPRAVLTAAGLSLSFGERGSPEGFRYLAIGDRIHLVSDRHYHSVAAPLADFVDTAPLLPGTLQRLELPGGVLQRLGDPPRWTWDGDGSGGDGAALAAAWEGCRARSVHPLAPATAVGLPVSAWVQGRAGPIRFELLAAAGDQPVLLRRDLRLAYLLSPETAAGLQGAAPTGPQR